MKTNLALLVFFFTAAAASGVPTLEVSAGNVYVLNINTTQAPTHWIAFFGLALPSGNQTIDSLRPSEFDANDSIMPQISVFYQDLYYAPTCWTMQDTIFISTSPIPPWETLHAATIEQLNAAANTSNESSESAQYIFQANGTLTVGNQILSGVPYHRPNPTNATPPFDIFALQDSNGVLVFALPFIFPAREGFDGTQLNYELILPRNGTYYVLSNPLVCRPSVASGGSSTSVTVPESKTEIQTTEEQKPPEKEKTIFPRDEVVVIAETENAIITAEIKNGQTILSIIYRFDKTGRYKVSGIFPIHASYFEKRLAEAQIIKIDENSRQIQIVSKKVKSLEFQSTFNYTVRVFENRSVVEGEIDAESGDIYVLQVTIEEELVPELIQRTYSFPPILIPADREAPLKPSGKTSQVQITYLISDLIPIAAALLGITLALVLAFCYALWTKPWIRHYLNAHRFGYVYHYFHARTKRT